MAQAVKTQQKDRIPEPEDDVRNTPPPAIAKPDWHRKGVFLVMHNGEVVESVEVSTTAYSARAAAVTALGLVWSNLAKKGYTIQEAILVPFDPAPDANIASQTAQALQAQIDRLMLEFCPEDMTEAQKARWAAHQKPV